MNKRQIKKRDKKTAKLFTVETFELYVPPFNNEINPDIKQLVDASMRLESDCHEYSKSVLDYALNTKYVKLKKLGK